uniref:Keratin-associated protein n=1 Tax=Nannospalax galili TaxID=1026970 RepID=A0A8C6R3C6_NANGA
PCQAIFSGSLGFGSAGFQSCGWGWPSVDFGSHGFQSLNRGSNFYRPTYFSSKSCQSVSYRP